MSVSTRSTPARAATAACTIVLALATACGGGAGSAPAAPADSVVGESGNLALSGHVLRRAAFGATPQLLDQLTQLGTGAWLNQQLDPDSIDLASSARLQTLVAKLDVPTSEHDPAQLMDLVGWRLAHALYSPRQLQEQMLDFWENHFSTSWYTVLGFTGSMPAATWFEWQESERFRAHALGRFETLLIDSATSPAMLVMLDSIKNVAGSPNENYARELLELHAMGVDNGYTQQDVEQIARCFTGWTLAKVDPARADDPHAPTSSAPNAVWAFHFDWTLHDQGPKAIFAGTPYAMYLPPRYGKAGIQDGFDVLRQVAALPQTAGFVSSKLIRKLVCDDPPKPLVAKCKQVWQQTGGDVRSVLIAIFNASEFSAAEHLWCKVPSPLEQLLGTVRALDGDVATLGQLVGLQSFLDGALGQALFRWPNPDGYPEVGEKQLGTAKVLERVRFNSRIAEGGVDDVEYDVRALLAAHSVPLDDPAAIVDWLARVFFQGAIDATDRQAAIDFLGTDLAGHPAALDPNAPDHDLRVRLTAAFVASSPNAVQQ